MRKFFNDSGFTLIEIMIAIFILTVGLLGVAGVAITVINGNAFSNKITTATALTQDKMEELRGTAYTSISDGGPETLESIYTRTWAVTDDSPVDGMKTIEVNVKFQWKGSSRNVTLQTMAGQ
ncbi:MAG: prepilin-type N-terminal cleavage/methylation domain-containing protein [Desulfobacterales bacterium]|nr:prepilin-type N-terminal cleavage/methylation domain-containing protein [Desulfobacterales bacterium]MDD4391665.1 prepilin-type N-terminal cleavage/methylation domain-containing protein [Desulfobacterales bacterium]